MAQTSVDELTDVAQLVDEALEDLWAVVVLNDDVTTFETVITALVVLFQHSPEAAEALAWQVHRSGRAIVHVASEEEAAQGVVALHGYRIQATMLPTSDV